MYSLGIDIGSSSVKVSLLEIESGRCVASSTNPGTEAPIKALKPGWAEQDPDSWMEYVCAGIKSVGSEHDLRAVKSIGITYQMHGLVALDRSGNPVRDSIIWCDSRAVELGARAFGEIGAEKCMSHLLNSPGNFTASKLAWVRENEPDVYKKIYRFMLPGDYIAYRLSGQMTTTATGLSEGILWDFKNGCRADFVADYYGIESNLFCEVVPSIGDSVRTKEEFMGIPAGTPVTYRAGDQPNNAFSLDVLHPGEIAATGGTSGVVYGVTSVPEYDPQSRVNTFLHVNSTEANPVYGILLCINGTGILNSWLHHNVCPQMSYAEMNELAATVPAGCDGLSVLPFGNGAERVLCNKRTGAVFSGLDFVRHSTAHMLRAAQEGIAFSFRYGIDIMKGMGLKPDVIRAGKANLFLSPLFRSSLSTLTDARIELFNTDGSLGAARGAALGAGLYRTEEEAFRTLERLAVVEPESSWKEPLEEAYQIWLDKLNKEI